MNHTHDGMCPDRRDFLKTSLVATGVGALAGPLAARSAPAGKPRGGTKVTVVLFQRGGADHCNLYAPVGDPQYAIVRPTIRVMPPGSTTGVVGLHMSNTFAMHPAMAGTHAAFTAAGSTAAVVHAVGYQPFNRSHFVSQDLYETALQMPTPGNGWINRHLQATATTQDPPVRALAISGAMPRAMLGLYPCYAVASTVDLRFLGDPDTRQYVETLTEQTTTAGMAPQRALAYQSGIDTFAMLDHFAGLNPTAYVPANGAVYPTGSLGRALREVAEVIKLGLGVEFFTVDQQGWDHHSNLVANIQVKALELDAATNAFFTDLGALAADIVLVTMSEFGRELGENGSLGTDHGAAGAMLVRGGAVNGGQVHGVWPGILPGARFLSPVNDYRDVLREILEQHMGGTDPNAVFPGRTYVPIGVL